MKKRARTLVRVVFHLAAAAALVSLVVEFGFPPGPHLPALRWLEIFAVSLFVVNAAGRLVTAGDRRAWTRRSWLELSLLALLAVGTAGFPLVAQGSALARLYLVAAQVYLLAGIVLALLRANEAITARLARPAAILVGSFLLLILLGTGALLLPNCRAPGARPWSFLDALFTATSAACVTGLGVRDIGTQLSFQGQLVVLVLIQLGGLGLVTVTLFVTYLQGRSIKLGQAVFLREAWSAQAFGDPGRFLRYVLAITAVAEITGAAILFEGCREPGLSPGQRAWWAVFHSVSAFCNAGFSLHSDSFVRYADSALVTTTLMVLIVSGGIGFTVMLDLLGYDLRNLPVVRRWRWTLGRRPADSSSARITLHSKLVISTTAVLLAGGAIGLHLSDRIAPLSSLFQSVTARTAGFNTVEIARLSLPTLLLLMVLMAVGASPSSTGGGIRTSTLAVLFLVVRSMLRGRDHVDAFGRTVPRASVHAAISIAALYGVAVLVTTSLLLATQTGMRFVDLLFESVSALSTVGLSTGVTGNLDAIGRLILCLAMLVGRVGPLGVLWTLISRPPALRYQYPEEPVVVS